MLSMSWLVLRYSFPGSDHMVLFFFRRFLRSMTFCRPKSPFFLYFFPPPRTLALPSSRVLFFFNIGKDPFFKCRTPALSPFPLPTMVLLVVVFDLNLPEFPFFPVRPECRYPGSLAVVTVLPPDYSSIPSHRFLMHVALSPPRCIFFPPPVAACFLNAPIFLH